MTPRIQWRQDLERPEWDRLLSSLHGHALQSRLWGDSREKIDGIRQHAVAAFIDGECRLMARIEVREPMPGVKVAWIPRGPAWREASHLPTCLPGLVELLGGMGFSMVAVDPYAPIPWLAETYPQTLADRPRTMVLDLSGEESAVFAATHRKFRQYVRGAARNGIEVRLDPEGGRAKEFFALCEGLGREKGFDLHGSEALVREILDSEELPWSSAHLFLALVEGKVAGGFLVARIGESVHEIWGGVAREDYRRGVGESLRWEVVRWCKAHGVRRYDLEGIDPENNPGTYEAKRRLRGAEVDLPGIHVVPIGIRGKVLAIATSIFRR